MAGTVFHHESDCVQSILLGGKGHFLVLSYHRAEGGVEDYASGDWRGMSTCCWLQLQMPFLVLMCRWVGGCGTCIFPLPAELQGSSSRKEGTRRRSSPFVLDFILVFTSPSNTSLINSMILQMLKTERYFKFSKRKEVH